MTQQIDLFSFYLPRLYTRVEMEAALKIQLKKGIEATFYTQIDDAIITFTQFNVLTMINCPHDKIVEHLNALGVAESYILEPESISQDYPILIDTELDKDFAIDNETITLKEYSLINLIMIAHVISQSVALEVYEKKLSNYYEKSRHLIDASNTFSIFKRARLARFVKELVLVRHDVLIDLHLLDKPNILWDNEDVELLYNRLASSLELKDRFDIIEYKLNSIKDDIMLVMDLANHNHSSFLEWIIILLIAVEIGMTVYEWMK